MIKKGLYRHFKGGMYEVIGVGKHSEDMEDYVVYKHLDEGSFWVRPLKMFEEEVEIDGRNVKRFEFVSENSSGKLKIKIKKLVPEAKIPHYSKEGDAAMDVYAVSKKITDNYIEYGTGLAFEIPKDYVMLIFPRSSVSNKALSQANSVGVLDSGYRGELLIRFYKLSEEEYDVGDRIAQIMILPRPKIEFEEVSELSSTERGSGGFGSTGM